MNKLTFPLPGMRIFKSVCAVFLCFAVYVLRGMKGIPFYSALAALQCMQPYTSSTIKTGILRIRGTMIGAAWGCAALLIAIAIPEQYRLLTDLLISGFVGLVLYSTVLLKCKDSAYFSCVVFLSITVNHIADVNPYLFVFNRVLDTLIGVAVGLAVNAFHLPRTKHREILFVSGIDETILDRNDRLSDYSRVELNRLMDEGCQFTVSTTETPATVRELLEGVRLPLPIIAMDGAVLYDMNERKYLAKKPMTGPEAARMLALLRAHGRTAFINTVEDDLLVIYYDELRNEAQRDIYERRRKSPYRNYVQRAEPVTENVLYLFFIDKAEAVHALYSEICAASWCSDYRIVLEPSRRFAGYAWMKIYSAGTTRASMLEVLKETVTAEKTVTFGSIEGVYDVYIADPSRDSMVHQLKKLYEPVSLRRKPSP